MNPETVVIRPICLIAFILIQKYSNHNLVIGSYYLCKITSFNTSGHISQQDIEI